MKTPEEKIEPLHQFLVEQGWELQDSVDDVAMRIMDMRREIQLAFIRIKEKMTIYLAVILFAMVILVKALAFALRNP
jgi:DNA polymerase III delta prime subunit